MSEPKPMQECIVSVQNKPGEGAKVLEAAAKAGVNLRGLVAYGIGPDAARVHVLAEDAERVRRAMSDAGYECESAEGIVVELDDSPGRCAKVLKKLADAGVDMEHCYATSTGSGACSLVLRTSDNQKALSVLRGADG